MARRSARTVQKPTRFLEQEDSDSSGEQPAAKKAKKAESSDEEHSEAPATPTEHWIPGGRAQEAPDREFFVRGDRYGSGWVPAQATPAGQDSFLAGLALFRKQK